MEVDFQKAAEIYEMKRARYVGGIDQYADSIVAYVEIMKQSLEQSTTKQPVELTEREEERFESSWTAEELLSQAHLMLTMGPGKRDALSQSLAKRISKHLSFPKLESQQSGDWGVVHEQIAEIARREFDVHYAESLATKVMDLCEPYFKSIEREFIGWEPIETAPKDGTKILVACLHNDGRINCVADVQWREGDYEDFWDGLEGIMSEVEIKLWMPLLQPPEQWRRDSDVD